MKPSEWASAPHVEERGVLKRVRAAKADRESSCGRDWLDDCLRELLQPGRADLVRATRGLNHKTQFLKHDVEEMVRVQANASQLRQLLTQDCEIWLQHLCGNPNNACRV